MSLASCLTDWEWMVVFQDELIEPDKNLNENIQKIKNETREMSETNQAERPFIFVATTQFTQPTA